MESIAALFASRQAAPYLRGMGFKPSDLEPWQKEAANRLRTLVEASGKAQETLGVGSQAYVSQMLTKRRPIGPEAAAKFASALGCKVDDFSPELADQVRALAALVEWEEGSPQSWPFSTSREDFNGLSRARREIIDRVMAEQLILERTAATAASSKKSSPSQSSAARRSHA